MSCLNSSYSRLLFPYGNHKKQHKFSLKNRNNKLSFSTTFHPQTDEKTKVISRSQSTLLRVILKGNNKSWDEYLPHIEFAYNCVVHCTTTLSPFDVVYGFNPITPLDLLPLPTSFDFVHKEGVSKSKFIKDLHEKVRNQIQT